MIVRSDDWLRDAHFLPRVSGYNWRAVESFVAQPALPDPPPALNGAIVTASFASADPELLPRFRELGVPYLIDPEVLRFLAPTFADVRALTLLPYAPREMLAPTLEVRPFVAGALEFQHRHGAAAYLVPALTTPADDAAWAMTNLAIHRTAAALNGLTVERRPLVGFVAPDRIALRQPEATLGPLGDIPISALYVQPTRLRPTHDGVEKLVALCTFLDSARRSLNVPIIVGRVGAFGLALTALGFDAFDSGLGEAESFDLSQLNRRPSRGERAGRVRGSGRRVYLRQLMTTLPARYVEALLSEHGVRISFTCTLPCCRWDGFDDLPARRWTHYLYTRLDEVAKLARLPMALRVAELRANLSAAAGHAQVARRVLQARGVDPPSFHHLDAWDAVVSRAATAMAA